MTDDRTRAFRSLVGLAVGDALGQRYFGEAATVLPRIAARELPPAPWAFTDDTVMALSVFETLCSHGTVDQDDLAQRFAKRYTAEPFRGYGNGARRLLAAIDYGAPWRKVARDLFDGSGSYGNGAAMRVAPLGAFFADSLDRVAAEAALSAEVTHTHDDGIAGAVAIAVASGYFATHDQPQRDDLFTAVLEYTDASETRDGIERARTLGADEPIGAVTAALGSGDRVAAFDTVPFCIWVVSHFANDFEQAFWKTVEGLGDRDTTCAIVGGILATRVAPPSEWVEATEQLQVESY